MADERKRVEAAGPGRPEDLPPALALLREDHERVQALFEEYERTTLAQQDTFFEVLKHELDTHALVEEEVFYPALEEEAGAAELARRAREDHQEVREAVADVVRTQPGDPYYDDKVERLRERVRAHVEEEERELFARARRLGPERLARLAAEMSARRGQILAESSFRPGAGLRPAADRPER
jgi:hemerythrin superfamily protein